MKTPARISSREGTPKSGQRGVALVVGMVLLVVATVLGLAGIRGTTLQERMSSNMYDRSLAMQAAEAALRAAEAAITANPSIGIDCSAASATLCVAIPVDTFNGVSAQWSSIPAAFRTNSDLSDGIAQFHIRFMGQGNTEDELGLTSSANAAQYGGGGGVPTANYYRVTARSHDPTDPDLAERSVVVLSTTVRRNI
jgi:type IV pilus assembly protein PilX